MVKRDQLTNKLGNSGGPDKDSAGQGGVERMPGWDLQARLGG